MGNLIVSFRKMIINKNTVTVLGLILCIVVIFFGYNYRINSSIKPVIVPYAKVKILGGVQITSKMVGTTKVPPSMLEGDVIQAVGEVVDKYSNADTIIPKGSLFYKRTVVEKEKLPANIILDYPAGYVLYNMKVNTETTYGNSIYPGNYIDIFLKVEREDQNENSKQDGKVMLGKLLSHVKVIAVKDESGRAVFENKDEERAPAMVIFAVPEEYYILLSKASFLRSYSSKLIPVPTNESLKENPGEVEMSSDSLKEWINNVTVWIDK